MAEQTKQTKPPRYWVIVASKDHVQRGIAEGIAQACHGKAAPLRRMRPGDGVVFYSPKLEFKGQARCQAFTAIGQVKNELIYQCDMGSGFVPHRRDIIFSEAKEVAIQPLLGQLSFIKDKGHWGHIFRFGFFEIPQADFEFIAGLMQPVSNKITEAS